MSKILQTVGEKKKPRLSVAIRRLKRERVFDVKKVFFFFVCLKFEISFPLDANESETKVLRGLRYQFSFFNARAINLNKIWMSPEGNQSEFVYCVAETMAVKCGDVESSSRCVRSSRYVNH